MRDAMKNNGWFLLVAAVLAPTAAVAASCESLSALALPDATITLARSIPAGELSLPGAPAAAARQYQELPTFCRVAATLKPTSDSDIQIEVWLPASGWNGKFQAVGNGGWAGSISYSAMGQALRRGYATASTDTGHTGGSARFALGHHEKLIDFGYRAVHEMTLKSKSIVAAFYGDAPKLSYWNGCSTGGRQGLKEAQQYPSDFDGIIAGATANFRTHLQIGQIWTACATLKDPASFIPPAKYPLIHKAAVDAGHTGGSARFALGHHEKLIDFGYRAVHEMTVKSKSILAAFYGDAPKLSYWNGCSTGGRQGLKEAQQYPSDFDGIIAGAPANFRTHLQIGQIWTAGATLKDSASFIPPAKYPLIHKDAVDACDALDGVKDGVLENPSRCHFDPKVLECKGEDAATCLTAPQVEAARKIYAGAKNPRTGLQIWPGLLPGSELGWGQTAGGPEPIGLAMAYFRDVVFEDPNWDWRTFNFDADTTRTEKLEYGMNATDPNLKQFVGHGGKLLLYHGWSDQLITPMNSISYYKSVADTMGGAAKTADFARLFLVPGMGHCGGGEGPNSFDSVSALEQWVEK